jgi:putative ABC transport system substrate-binding protein
VKRRDFIALLSGTVATWPMAARGQQGDRVRRVGALIVGAEGDPGQQALVTAFRMALAALNWTEGRNLQLDVRWASGDAGRMATLAAELVATAPEAILASATPATTALQRATRTIPIVFVGVVDPVAGGLVASLAHPGGNITGFSNFEYTIAGKWLEVLKEMAPRTRRVLVVAHSGNPTWVGHFRTVEATAPVLDLAVTRIDPLDIGDLARAIESFAREPNGGIVVLPAPFGLAHREAIIELAVKHRLPSVYGDSEFVRAGGLASYGVASVELYRLAASYVDRILRGERPADLPVQVAPKYQLVINLKNAKSIGLTIPEGFLLRADELIE